MTSASSVSASATVFGGEHVDVAFRDGHTESILVRELPIDPGLVRVVELAMDEPALVEYVCGQPLGWAATLTRASLLDLADKALALNFSIARRYVELRAKTAAELKALNPITLLTSSAGAPASS